MRKTRLSAEERRKQILKKARKVFAARGYQGTRTRDIAGACGINEATIYKHFKGKEDLFLAVLNDVHDEVVEVGRDSLEASGEAVGVLRSVIQFLWDKFVGDPDIGRTIMHAMIMSVWNERVREVLGRRLAGHHEYLERQMERGIQDGTLRSDLDPSEAAALILGLGIAYTLLNAADLVEAFKVPGPIPLFRVLVEYMLPESS